VETVQVARHPDRPMLTDYLNLLFDEFVELHGDKSTATTAAVRTGFPSSIASRFSSSATTKVNAQRSPTMLLRLRPS